MLIIIKMDYGDNLKESSAQLGFTTQPTVLNACYVLEL